MEKDLRNLKKVLKIKNNFFEIKKKFKDFKKAELLNYQRAVVERRICGLTILEVWFLIF